MPSTLINPSGIIFSHAEAGELDPNIVQIPGLLGTLSPGASASAGAPHGGGDRVQAASLILGPSTAGDETDPYLNDMVSQLLDILLEEGPAGACVRAALATCMVLPYALVPPAAGWLALCAAQGRGSAGQCRLLCVRCSSSAPSLSPDGP